MKRLLLTIGLLASFAAHAALTTAQVATLRADILASEFAAQCVPSGDGPYNIAAAYNLPKSPAFTVWKTAVPIAQVGIAQDATEVAGLTTANTSRLQVYALFSGGTFNASNANVRAGFDSVFSGAGGATTRASLLALWKRTATRSEALFATGTGSDASPATMTAEGALAVADAIRACTP